MTHRTARTCALAALACALAVVAQAAEDPAQGKLEPSDDLILNYHLMHPGGASLPGDPNAAFLGSDGG